MKLTIPDPMKDYTVNEDIIFFEEGEKISLSDLQKIFTLPAIAELISNDKVTRDCHVIVPNGDKKECFTAAFDGEDFSNFCFWERYLTSEEVYQLEIQGTTVELFSDPEQLFRKYQKMPYLLRNLILRACEDGEF